MIESGRCEPQVFRRISIEQRNDPQKSRAPEEKPSARAITCFLTVPFASAWPFERSFVLSLD